MSARLGLSPAAEGATCSHSAPPDRRPGRPDRPVVPLWPCAGVRYFRWVLTCWSRGLGEPIQGARDDPRTGLADAQVPTSRSTRRTARVCRISCDAAPRSARRECPQLPGQHAESACNCPVSGCDARRRAAGRGRTAQHGELVRGGQRVGRAPGQGLAQRLAGRLELGDELLVAGSQRPGRFSSSRIRRTPSMPMPLGGQVGDLAQQLDVVVRVAATAAPGAPGGDQARAARRSAGSAGAAR